MTQQEKWDLQEAQIRQLIEENDGVVKTAMLYPLGMDYRRIQAFVDKGVLRRIKNGYYGLAEQKLSEDEMILKLFGADGVLTMESALYQYGYINAKPYAYQIAIDKNTSKSRFNLDYPFVHPYYSEPQVLELGVTKIPFAGGEMRIFEKERVICDCLKYEDRLSHDLLKKALLSFLNDDEKDIARLLFYARERKVLTKVQNRIGVWL